MAFLKVPFAFENTPCNVKKIKYIEKTPVPTLDFPTPLLLLCENFLFYILIKIK